jgi:hypothetical protein
MQIALPDGQRDDFVFLNVAATRRCHLFAGWHGACKATCVSPLAGARTRYPNEHF